MDFTSPTIDCRNTFPFFIGFPLEKPNQTPLSLEGTEVSKVTTGKQDYTRLKGSSREGICGGSGCPTGTVGGDPNLIYLSVVTSLEQYTI